MSKATYNYTFLNLQCKVFQMTLNAKSWFDKEKKSICTTISPLNVQTMHTCLCTHTPTHYTIYSLTQCSTKATHQAVRRQTAGFSTHLFYPAESELVPESKKIYIYSDKNQKSQSSHLHFHRHCQALKNMGEIKKFKGRWLMDLNDVLSFHILFLSDKCKLHPMSNAKNETKRSPFLSHVKFDTKTSLW